MAQFLSRLADHGFDITRLRFATRTAIAACIAFVLAWLIGLEHPQWSAMTVWAASQPTRGQLWEKSLFRGLGSISGTIVGVLLVLSMQLHPSLLVIGLALWVGACTYIGNLQRGFVAYGTVLAGYTAAMVSLLDAAHPDQVLGLGADRLATVMTGIVVATFIGSLFAPKAATGELRQKVRALLTEMLAESASATPSHARRRQLLSDLASIEEGLDPHAAGSIRSRQSIRATRTLLIAATPLLLWKHGDSQPAGFRSHLTAASVALTDEDMSETLAALKASAETPGLSPRLRETLTTLSAALANWHADPHARRTLPNNIASPAKFAPLSVVLHRDWTGAREAGLRALGALLLFGGLWLVTGWSVGAFMLLGLSVMISLFSTFENPAQMMKSVFRGQLAGVIGALILRWLVWPMAETETQMILFTLPFILIGPLFVAHNKTVAMSFDYNMVLMLMSQPHWPLTGTFETSVAAGLAVIAAPVAAMVAYLTVYPANLKRRLDTLMTTMLHDLSDLAADPKALQGRSHWQARLYHRTLRLVRLSERAARAQTEAQDAALALLNLGHAAMWCHREAQANAESNRMAAHEMAISESDRRAARAALMRLAYLREDPTRARATLLRLQARHTGPEAALLREAVSGIDTLTPLLTTLD
ncbi:FUSC family protein [Celeribacter sp. PS-C1]|uniref:FUSC family protein n=1 Tax=Celeribacter sp. PS-C1 TaxID=2820813 RepID=UPI001C67FECA|nr:FUSC family protein [Celeribacter sp. PS-C1]MBW6416866.1 FUSC family protein [Celeribacter sp. PS-C1]